MINMLPETVHDTDIYTFLKVIGIPASDCKTRLKNNQIKLNTESVDFNTSKNLKFIAIFDAGDFIFHNMDLFKDIGFLTIDEIFICDIPVIRKRFNGYSLLKISKKQYYILRQ